MYANSPRDSRITLTSHLTSTVSGPNVINAPLDRAAWLNGMGVVLIAKCSSSHSAFGMLVTEISAIYYRSLTIQ